MKVNFYRDIASGFELVRSHLALEGADYARSFLSADLTEPEDNHGVSARPRHERTQGAYLCCLYRAGFKVPDGFRVKFQGNKDLNRMARADGSLDPNQGLTPDQAADWFGAVWENYDDDYFADYKRKNGHEWAD